MVGLPKRIMGPERGHKGTDLGTEGPHQVGSPKRAWQHPKDQNGTEQKTKFWIQTCALVSPFLLSV